MIFTEKCSCCVLRVTKKGNFTPSAFSSPTPHRHFSSKMAVRLPTPKVDLSKSILNSTEIPGLGDILITHPDVTTDFDWPEMVPWRGRGFHKTLASLNGHLKRWRRTIVLASLHWRRRSYVPSPPSRRNIIGRTETVFRPAARRYVFVFNGKCCYSATNDPSSSSVSAALTHTFCFF